MAAFSPRMLSLGTASSEIREAFAFAQQRIAQAGPQQVEDFSLGNPSVPAPEAVREAALALFRDMDPVHLHGYTPAQGDASVRAALAADLNARYHTDYDAGCLYLTCGAAGALCCVLSALGCPGDEFITFSPYFPEYQVFVESAGGRLITVPARPEDFQMDLDALAEAITPNTKAVLINTPNNPTGVVYPKEDLQRLGTLLQERSKAYGHTIYLISDEPYREIYFSSEPAWVPDCYPHTIVCYSYSKSLSLPGQRLGYLLIPPAAEDASLLYAAVCGAGRALGYVCAPSLFQFVAAKCTGITSDVQIYKENRDLLLSSLREMGYVCPQPDGAFYLFPQTPEPDARAFCARARALDLILVPGDSFGCGGHVRISYCVQPEQIQRALPKFRQLV